MVSGELGFSDGGEGVAILKQSICWGMKNSEITFQRVNNKTRIKLGLLKTEAIQENGFEQPSKHAYCKP